MTNEQIARAQKLRNEGQSYQAIAKVIGMSRSAIRYSLNPEAKEKQHLLMAQYRKTHKEEMRLYSSQYRKEHKEKIRLRNVEYYKIHKDQICRTGREYYKTHKEEKRLYDAKYHRDHQEHKREYARTYQKTHGDQIRRTRREHYRTHKAEEAARDAMKRALIAGAALGNLNEIKEIYRITREEPRVRCYLCGKIIKKGRRHVDHIFPLSKGGAHRPSNLAATCDKCNEKKHDKMPEEMGILL